MKPAALIALALLLVPGVTLARGPAPQRIPTVWEWIYAAIAAADNNVQTIEIMVACLTETGLKRPPVKRGKSGERGICQVTERTAAPVSKGGVGCKPGWDEHGHYLTPATADCAARVLARVSRECPTPDEMQYAYNIGNCRDFWINDHVERSQGWRTWLKKLMENK